MCREHLDCHSLGASCDLVCVCFAGLELQLMGLVGQQASGDPCVSLPLTWDYKNGLPRLPVDLFFFFSLKLVLEIKLRQGLY